MLGSESSATSTSGGADFLKRMIRRSIALGTIVRSEDEGLA